MKKVLSLLIIMAVVLSSVGVFANDIRVPENLPTETLPAQSSSAVKQETPKVTFSDVDANTATGKAIYKLVNAGILNGYEDGTFRPNNPLTRAELCKIVNLVFNYTESEEVSFSDMTKNDWFYNYVAVAKKAGYITGHADGTFKGNDYLTREQTCTIITRVAKPYDIPLTETITDNVSEWAVPYVNKVVANKLMPLEAGGKFRATENITRAELVVALSGFVSESEKPAESTTTTQYTVTFNTNGGSTMVAAKVDSGKTIAEPGDPTKAGYTFDGWYTDSALTKPYDFNTAVTANITLYAKWTKGAATGGGGGGGGGGGTTTTTKYTVTFNTNGGSALNSVKVESGKTVSKPADPTKSGYTFAGWYTDSGLTKAFSFSTKITANITLYAKWTANNQGGNDTPNPPATKTYTVTFNTNGGSSIDDVTVENGDTVSQPEAPERYGYIFDGWYTTSALTTEYDFSSPITKNTTIHAKWNIGRLVTFETNGGEYIEPVFIEHGHLLPEPQVAERPGYYFMGWYNEPEFIGKFNFSNVIHKDITIYAKWVEMDPEKLNGVVTDMNDLRTLVYPLIGEFELDAANEILSIVYEVMGNVIVDANNGIPVYDGDYILDHDEYSQKISYANQLYDGMSKDDQSNFYSVLLTELGEEKADRLLQTMFGIDISDAKDQIDK